MWTGAGAAFGPPGVPPLQSRAAGPDIGGAASPGPWFPLKHPKRLDETRLVEALSERGLVEASVLAEHRGEGPIARSLVSEGAISDWDLSRVVSEVFHLPFLPVNIAQPDRDLLDGLPSVALREHGLVPLCRQGDLLTVAMPGMVGAPALAQVGAETGLRVMPVVGTVLTNRRWLEENACGPQEEPGPAPEELSAEWADLFDEGDAAVHLQGEGDPEPLGLTPAEQLEAAGDSPTALPPPPQFG